MGSDSIDFMHCLDVKSFAKPCAGKQHARFDEGGQVQAYSVLDGIRNLKVY
jgi:hypothetical protein